MKGGLPMNKAPLTFLLLIFIGLSTALTVLFVNAKRDLLRVQRTEPQTSQTASPISTAVPAPKPVSSVVALPKPQTVGKMTVDQAIASRRSRREYAQTSVTLANLGQVVWAAQGVTDPATGKRTAPSAREGYPYTVYVVVRNVAGMNPGLYVYRPQTHDLGSLGLANAGEMLTSAGVQDGAQKAPVVLVLAASYGKSAQVMKDAAQSSTLLEGGHIGQNIYLEVESLGMSTVVMAGFDAKKVGDALKLDPAETAVYVIPLGNRAPEVPKTASPTPEKKATP